MRTMFYGSNARTFKYAKKLRDEMTEAEKIPWWHLSANQINGYRFKRRHPVKNYIADFYCHKAKLIIEVDGKIHEQEEQMARDRERTAAIEESGCRVWRFTNNEIKNQIKQVIKTIKNELPPTQPPARRLAFPSGRLEGHPFKRNKIATPYETTHTTLTADTAAACEGIILHHRPSAAYHQRCVCAEG